jgi:hypothetical protein
MINGSRQLFVALFAVTAGTTSCGEGITSPRPPPVEVHPQLDALSVSARSSVLIFAAPPTVRANEDPPGLVDEEPFPGLFSMGGWTFVATDSIPDGGWTRAIIRTEGGDSEEVRLRAPSGVCRTQREMFCWVVTADVVSLDAARALHPLVAARSGAIAGVWAYVDGRVTVNLLLPDRAEDTQAEVRRWPGVVNAGPEIGFIRDNPGLRPVVTFSGWLPLDSDSPVSAGDGVVQAKAGEGYVVEYHQPDGSTLIHSGVVD